MNNFVLSDINIMFDAKHVNKYGFAVVRFLLRRESPFQWTRSEVNNAFVTVEINKACLPHVSHTVYIRSLWVWYLYYVCLCAVFLVVDKIEFYSASKSCLRIEHLLYKYRIARYILFIDTYYIHIVILYIRVYFSRFSTDLLTHWKGYYILLD